MNWQSIIGHLFFVIAVVLIATASVWMGDIPVKQVTNPQWGLVFVSALAAAFGIFMVWRSS